MTPARGLLRVKPVETDETLPGGRIALVAETRERMTAWQCEVIARGEDAECKDDDCERQHRCLGCNGAFLFRVAGTPSLTLCAHTSSKRLHPSPVVVGAWLLVRPRSFIAGPNPNVAEWYVHQDDVLAILEED